MGRYCDTEGYFRGLNIQTNFIFRFGHLSSNINLILLYISTEDANSLLCRQETKGEIMSIQSSQTSTNTFPQQSSERNLRKFVSRFGRTRLSELYAHVHQGIPDAEILQIFAISGAQLESIKKTLVEHSSKRKHG